MEVAIEPEAAATYAIPILLNERKDEDRLVMMVSKESRQYWWSSSPACLWRDVSRPPDKQKLLCLLVVSIRLRLSPQATQPPNICNMNPATIYSTTMLRNRGI